jgi:hypothetical protein
MSKFDIKLKFKNRISEIPTKVDGKDKELENQMRVTRLRILP